ncbi:MAG: hypothetical protein ABI614_26215, partial [Planctomycetota bacterium]
MAESPERIPYALTNAHSELVAALEYGIEQFNAIGKYSNSHDVCRCIANDAQSVEADGCFYLSGVYHAWDSSATKMEATAEAFLKTNFGGANLESVRTAADSLFNWVGRILSEKPTEAQKVETPSALTDSEDRVQTKIVDSGGTLSDLNPPQVATDGAHGNGPIELVKPTDDQAEAAELTSGKQRPTGSTEPPAAEASGSNDERF